MDTREAKTLNTSHMDMKQSLELWINEISFLKRVATGLAETQTDQDNIDEIERHKSAIDTLGDELNSLGRHFSQHMDGKEQSNDHIALQGEMNDWYARFRQMKDDFYAVEARLSC